MKKATAIIIGLLLALGYASAYAEQYTNNSECLINVAFTDDGSGLNEMWYTVNGGDESPHVPYADQITVHLEEGPNQVLVYVSDVAGNVGTHKQSQGEIILDTIPPGGNIEPVTVKIEVNVTIGGVE